MQTWLTQKKTNNFQFDQSNDHQVTLHNVGMDLTGEYRCEVSTDFPHFYTKVVAGYMHVVSKYLQKMK